MTQDEEKEVSSYSMTSIQHLGTIMKEVRKEKGRKINLIGHILRSDCFPKNVTERQKEEVTQGEEEELSSYSVTSIQPLGTIRKQN